MEYSGIEETDDPTMPVLTVEVNPPAASGGGGFCGVR